jgi:hypothetical protein
MVHAQEKGPSQPLTTFSLIPSATHFSLFDRDLDALVHWSLSRLVPETTPLDTNQEQAIVGWLKEQNFIPGFSCCSLPFGIEDFLFHLLVESAGIPSVWWYVHWLTFLSSKPDRSGLYFRDRDRILVKIASEDPRIEQHKMMEFLSRNLTQPLVWKETTIAPHHPCILAWLASHPRIRFADTGELTIDMTVLRVNPKVMYCVFPSREILLGYLSL